MPLQAKALAVLFNTSARTVAAVNPVVLVYAARYALGRRTGAAADVEQAIAADLQLFVNDAGCREALIDDIELAAAENRLGALVDASCWNRTLGRLHACRDGAAR